MTGGVAVVGGFAGAAVIAGVGIVAGAVVAVVGAAEYASVVDGP